MKCNVCGYELDAFDADCPKCRRQRGGPGLTPGTRHDRGLADAAERRTAPIVAIGILALALVCVAFWVGRNLGGTPNRASTPGTEAAAGQSADDTASARAGGPSAPATSQPPSAPPPSAPAPTAPTAGQPPSALPAAPAPSAPTAPPAPSAPTAPPGADSTTARAGTSGGNAPPQPPARKLSLAEARRGFERYARALLDNDEHFYESEYSTNVHTPAANLKEEGRLYKAAQAKGADFVATLMIHDPRIAIKGFKLFVYFHYLGEAATTWHYQEAS